MVLMQQVPRSAEVYAREQRAQIKAAVAATLRQWSRMGTEFDASYLAIEPTLLAITTVGQQRIAAGAQSYIPAVLAETGQDASTFAAVRTGALVGVAGDGRPVDSLLYGAVTHAKSKMTNSPIFDEDTGTLLGFEPGMSPAMALRSASSWLSTTVGTLLSDTGRQSESLAMGVRPVTGYVRMLNPPSCSRCVVLAGKWFRKNEGFSRHPKCDCRHIPSSESMAGDLTVDPRSYFDSLTKTEQDATFGSAGGEALRSGADVSQVVNARRGMRSAQLGGRSVLTTTEGTTRRGAARLAMGQRYSRTARPRLMPETIQQLATDKADYLRLLSLHGYMG